MVDAKTKLKKNPSARYLTQNSWSNQGLVHHDNNKVHLHVMGGGEGESPRFAGRWLKYGPTDFFFLFWNKSV